MNQRVLGKSVPVVDLIQHPEVSFPVQGIVDQFYDGPEETKSVLEQSGDRVKIGVYKCL